MKPSVHHSSLLMMRTRTCRRRENPRAVLTTSNNRPLVDGEGLAASYPRVEPACVVSARGLTNRSWSSNAAARVSSSPIQRRQSVPQELIRLEVTLRLPVGPADAVVEL